MNIEPVLECDRYRVSCRSISSDLAIFELFRNVDGMWQIERREEFRGNVAGLKNTFREHGDSLINDRCENAAAHFDGIVMTLEYMAAGVSTSLLQEA